MSTAPDGQHVRYGSEGSAVLARPLRIRRPVEHRTIVRSGRRAAVGVVTVHLLHTVDGPARAGLVVGKNVGNSVARHRVSRRLRHLLGDRLVSLAPGTLVIVRAGAGAAAPGANLDGDLDGALWRAARAGTATRRRGQVRSRPDARP